MKTRNINLSATPNTVLSGVAAAQTPVADDPRSLFQVDTEKLLLSNDKVTITDLWKARPQPSFPLKFLDLIDLNALVEEAQAK